MKRYKIAAHTADAVLKAWGNTREELFCHAALGLFDMLVPPDSRNAGKGLSVERNVDLYAPSLEDLLVDWLNELLYNFEKDEAIFDEMELELVEGVAGFRLKARLLGIEYRIEGGKKGGEVKAATYHRLKVGKDKNGWRALITLDI